MVGFLYNEIQILQLHRYRVGITTHKRLPLLLISTTLLEVFPPFNGFHLKVQILRPHLAGMGVMAGTNVLRSNSLCWWWTYEKFWSLFLSCIFVQGGHQQEFIYKCHKNSPLRIRNCVGPMIFGEETNG